MTNNNEARSWWGASYGQKANALFGGLFVMLRAAQCKGAVHVPA